MQTLIKAEIQARLVEVLHRAHQPHGALSTRPTVWNQTFPDLDLLVGYHPLTLRKRCEKGGRHSRRSSELTILQWLFTKCASSNVTIVMMSSRKTITLKFQINDASRDWGQTDLIRLKYPMNMLKRMRPKHYRAWLAVQAERRRRFGIV